MCIVSSSARSMLVFFATVLISMSGVAAEITPVEPRCEYLHNPLGITSLEPRLSWKLQIDDQEPKEGKQAAFQLLVASTRAMLVEGKGNLWDSGKIESHESLHHVYRGKPLSMSMVCWWIVPDPKKPGYEHFFVRPQVCGDVTSCAASYESIRGQIESRWSVQDGQFELTVVVPAGATATVLLPGQRKVDGQQVGPGTHHFQTSFD